MATNRLFLALALFAACAFASAQSQSITVQGSYRTFDAQANSIESVYESHQDAVGPLGLDHETTIVSGTSSFHGTTRVTADYGQISLYARADLDHRMDAAYFNDVQAEALLFDPLTIVGGVAGGSLRASMQIDGVYDRSTGGSNYNVGWGASVAFHVFNESTMSWDYADQTIDSISNPGFFEFDYTQITTLANYDPSKSYALFYSASVSASPFGGDGFGDDSIYVETDASHTATLTGIGFLDGSPATFTGASGYVYPTVVPEPASLLALGAGLGFLRRRSKRKG